MAKALTSRMTLQLMETYTNALDLTEPVDSLTVNLQKVLANGNAAGQANRLFHDTLRVNNAALTWDLSTVTDAFGTAMGCDGMRGLILYNRNTVAGEYFEYDDLVANSVGLITVVDGTPTATEHLIKCGPTGILFWWFPIDAHTIDATHKIIGVDTTNSTKDVYIDMIFVGKI